MDQYNSLIPLVFRPIPWRGTMSAITVGQTTWYSCPKSIVDLLPEWKRHEEAHKRQWKREGALKFILKYLWYSVTISYIMNPYEIEAREAEKWIQ